MQHTTPLRVWALLAALSLTASGCGLGGGEDGTGEDPKKGPASQNTVGAAPPPKYAGALAKEGWAAIGGGRSRIEMKQIERFPDRSVLRFYVSNPDQTPRSFSYATSAAGSAFHEIDIQLIDPVGHKGYRPLVDNGGKGYAVGSDMATTAYPGVRYEVVLHFPPLPKDVGGLTVITPTTAGEFNGVPVVDGSGPRTPVDPPQRSGETPPAGSKRSMPMRKADGALWAGGTHDLYGLTESDVRTTSTSSGEQKIGLRTDVLFDFDKATLTAKARSVLDQVAAETREKADPAKPPIIVTGHTDSKGDDPYNLRLSRQRADAVLKELQTRLGTAYRYRASGKGETEPIAEEGGADDSKARAKNRRVEISYQIKRTTTQTTQRTTRAPQDRRGGGTGRPAAFHPEDGATVAKSGLATFTWGTTKRRMEVKPFYRDGAYLVAVFEIFNVQGNATLTESYMGDDGSWGRFGRFQVIDPKTGTYYRAVRIGPAVEDGPTNLNFVDPGWVIFQEKAGTSNRGFFYVPAPPADVTSVTFDAGPFGKFQNVPIREYR